MAEQNMQEMKSPAEMNCENGYRVRKKKIINPKTQREREEVYKSCYRCKEHHVSRTCKFKSVECYYGKKTGHIVKSYKMEENDERKRGDKENPGKAHCIQNEKNERFIYKINELSTTFNYY